LKTVTFEPSSLWLLLVTGLKVIDLDIFLTLGSLGPSQKAGGGRLMLVVAPPSSISLPLPLSGCGLVLGSQVHGRRTPAPFAVFVSPKKEGGLSPLLLFFFWFV